MVAQMEAMVVVILRPVTIADYHLSIVIFALLSENSLFNHCRRMNALKDDDSFHLNMKVCWPWFDQACNAFIKKPVQK